MAVLDATTLLHFLEPGVQAATDPATGEPVADAEARIERLVHDLQQAKETVLIPTPALSEVLVHAGEAAPDYLELLHNTARFRLVPFGERAAVELAAMAGEALAKGELDPFWWTPHSWKRRYPRCREEGAGTQQSTGSRWWIWSGPGGARTN